MVRVQGNLCFHSQFHWRPGDTEGLGIMFSSHTSKYSEETKVCFWQNSKETVTHAKCVLPKFLG